MSENKYKVAVLLSGAGSTMVNLQQHINSNEVAARIVVVVSSRRGVAGLERAREFGIPTAVLGRKKFKVNGVLDETAYSTAMTELLDRYEPDMVVMAGFMTRLAPPLIGRYPVLNVHPALLPMFGGEGFYGHHVHEAVLDGGLKISGATVHLADAEYDRGPIVMQEAVPVEDDDTPRTLAARVQAAERRIYPKAIDAFATGRAVIVNGRVKIAKEEPKR